MTDRSRLREAVDWVDSGPVVVGAKHIIELADAARRVLEPDYKAGLRAYKDAPVPIRAEDFTRRIIDAALGLDDPS